jgi:hypothetical protein
MMGGAAAPPSTCEAREAALAITAAPIPQLERQIHENDIRLQQSACLSTAPHVPAGFGARCYAR